MNSKIPTVAIVGRTNVGKSTLFNAMLGERRAVVEDVAGVTRDRHYALIRKYGDPFTLVDTGGLVGEDSDFHLAVRKQSEIAISQADLIIALFDGMAGPQPFDAEVVEALRRSDKKVLWVVNKCESPKTEQSTAEFYALGIDQVMPVSAAHKVGVKNLIQTLMNELGLKSKAAIEELLKDQSNAQRIHGSNSSGFKWQPELLVGNFDEQSEELGDDLEKIEAHTESKLALQQQVSRAIRVAILGKPNVGKSSLVNKILGEERLVTSPKPGTTTDAIDITIKREGQEYQIVDTAGLRREPKVEDGSVERYSNIRSLNALSECDVAVILMDASDDIPAAQDIKIAELAHERGRAIVLVINKWDLVEKDYKTVKEFENVVRNRLGFISYAPIVFVSALTGRRCPRVLELVKEVFLAGRKRIPTSTVNKLVERAIEKKSPGNYRGELVRCYFATQVGISPPSFVLMLNYPRCVNAAYQRFLKSVLREADPFVGNDLRLILKKKGEKRQERKEDQDSDRKREEQTKTRVGR